MTSESELPFELRAVDKIILEFTLRTCISLYWHDQTEPWPKTLCGGSCSIIRLASQLVGVTAAHVVRIFKDNSTRNPKLIAQLQNIVFDLNSALIDIDDETDIATFSVTEEQLAQINAVSIDCTTEWPPPPLNRPCAVSFAGFPETMRQVDADFSAKFSAFGALTIADDFTDSEIFVTFDPNRDRPIAGTPKPQLKYNMSGCSGGPVFEHRVRNGRRICFPVGIIVGGAGNCPKGVAQEFDMIRIRRIDIVHDDGTINRPSSGWLPT